MTDRDALIEAVTREVIATLGVDDDCTGDDCAVLQSGHRGRVDLLKTDCLVEGIHYTSATPPAKVGWKAVARVLSDFAAMGGQAEHLLVTTVLPPDREVRWAEQLYRGMNKCAVRFGAVIVGVISWLGSGFIGENGRYEVLVVRKKIS